MKDLDYSSSEATERENIRVANERRKQRSVELSDIREACKNAATRKLLWRVLEHCQCFQDAFMNDGSDALNYRIGIKSVGLFLMGEINQADPSILIKLIEENNDGLA
jgi:hypothetical protein